MEKDRKISEAAEATRKGNSFKDLTLESEQTSWLATNGVSVTDSSMKYVWNQNPKAKIVALFKGRGGATAGFFDSVTDEDDVVGVILDKTSFYYESGGQVYDTGALVPDDSTCSFTVDNVQFYGGYIVHIGRINGKTKLEIGTDVTARVDYNRRSLIAPNHTMTHVLNYALRTTLINNSDSEYIGTGLCDQRGSLCDHERFRFDFSWNGSLENEQIANIECIVKKQIDDQHTVFSEVLPLNSVMQISALRCVFGERSVANHCYTLLIILVNSLIV